VASLPILPGVLVLRRRWQLISLSLRERVGVRGNGLLVLQDRSK
jgi:hypothetical protein